MLKNLGRRCRKFKNFLLDLLFPIVCSGCGQEGAWLCPACFAKLKINSRPYNLTAPDIKKIFIAGDYDQKLLADLIKKYKYDFIPALGEDLSRCLINFWLENNLWGVPINKIGGDFNDSPGQRPETRITDPLVIPIPLSPQRLRWRGFNQAEILALHFCRHFNYELSLDLRRRKHRPAQAFLTEAARQKNVKDVFSWSGSDLSGRTVLLIDDVATTGATLQSAAETLKLAGNPEIYALVLAKG